MMRRIILININGIIDFKVVDDDEIILIRIVNYKLIKELNKLIMFIMILKFRVLISKFYLLSKCNIN